MNYSHEIERIGVEIARVKSEIKKTRRQIGRIEVKVTLAVAIEVIKQMRSAIDERLETIDEYVAGRRELLELESERATLEAQLKQRFHEIVLEAVQDRG